MASDVNPDESNTLVESLEIAEAWQKRITFVTGEGTFRADLTRVHTREAAACVVFNHAPEADRDNAVLSLSVASVNSKIPILVRMHFSSVYTHSLTFVFAQVPVWSSDNEPFAKASGPSTFVFSTKEFRSHLLANSLYTPGLPTLLLNLVRTKLRSQRSEKKHLVEYQTGRRIGIQVSPIADVKEGGERLMRLTQRLYTSYGGSILIGIVQADGVSFVPNRKHIVEGSELGIFLREEDDASLSKYADDDKYDDDENRNRKQLQQSAGRISMETARGGIGRLSMDIGRGDPPGSTTNKLRESANRPAPARRFSFDFQDSSTVAMAAGQISDRLPSIERVLDEPDLLTTFCYVSAEQSPNKESRKKKMKPRSGLVADAQDILDHFVVVAWGDDCDNLADLLVPLRSRALTHTREVVIIAEREPAPHVMSILVRFPDVYELHSLFIFSTRLSNIVNTGT